MVQSLSGIVSAAKGLTRRLTLGTQTLLGLTLIAIIVALVAGALFYLLGIVTDRIAAFVFPIVSTTENLKRLRFIQRKVERELNEEIDIRYRVYFKEGDFTTFLEFTLSRIRIVRATLINVPPVAVVVYVDRIVQSEVVVALVVALVATFTFFIIFVVFAALLLSYDVLQRQTRGLLDEGLATGALC